ncbi:MAG TPA: hypothetical protein VFX28_03630, partial [Methylomirabilota bacterium]|nr:hypothetical protein [Methylomirabilota bacterium]
RHPEDIALTCVSTEVGGDVVLGPDLVALGTCSLATATVGHGLKLTGSALVGEIALNLSSTHVGESVSLTRCACMGNIHAVALEVKGDLDCEGLELVTTPERANALLRRVREKQGGGPDETVAYDTPSWPFGLTAEFAVIGRRFRWLEVAHTTDVSVNLFHARAGALVDDEASWPTRGNLELDGFEYDSIAVGPTDALTRLRWISRAQRGGYHPQPYEQLARVLRAQGWPEEATRVAIAKLERRRRYATLTRWDRGVATVLRWTIGHGYRPQLALAWAALVVAAGALVFGQAQAWGLLVPITDRAVTLGFRSVGYSLDTFLPIIDLQQAAHWLPSGGAGPRVLGLPAGSWLWIYHWLHTVLGWALTTLAVAGFSGLVRRD